MAAYAMGGEWRQIFIFAALYFLSAVCPFRAGAALRERIHGPARIRLINRILAALLGVSACYLALAG